MSVVLVTGASGGIGGAIVTTLVGAGHQVIALGRDPGRLPAGPGVRCVVADLAEPGTLADAIEPLGHLDALVHCAGVSVPAIGPVAGTAPAVWRQMMAVNVMGAAELTRLALPALRRARGHVVFVSSSRGVRAAAGWSAFAASKAALRELADSLRAEEAVNGLRVTTIYPGATATRQLREVRAAFGHAYDPKLCLTPATVAEAVAWVLAAPQDGYVSELSLLAAPGTP